MKPTRRNVQRSVPPVLPSTALHLLALLVPASVLLDGAGPARASQHHDHASSPPGSVLSLDAAASAETLDLLVAVDAADGLELHHHRSRDGGRSWEGPNRVALGEWGLNRPHRGVDPQVASDGEVVLAAWTAHSDSSPFGAGELAISRSTDGGRTWTPGRSPSTYAGGGNSFADLLAGGASSFHVVWLDSRDGAQGLRASRSVDGGVSWEENRTLDRRTCECCWNTLAGGSGGELFALYRDVAPRDMALVASADAGATWKRVGSVGDFGWGIDGCPHAGGGLARTAAGSMLHALVWTGKEGVAGAYSLRSADGGRSWSEPLRLGGESARNVDLASRGDVLYGVWEERIGGESRILAAQSSDHGETWSEPETLSRAGDRATHPKVVASSGAAVALWTESDGAGPARWSHRVLANATPAPRDDETTTTHRLRGAVTDPVGGALRGAAVTAADVVTGSVRSTTTDARGRYALELPAGRYEVEARAELFQTRSTKIVLDRSGTLDLRLEIAVFAASVTVVERSRGELLMVPGGVAEIGSDDIEERVAYGNVEEVLALEPGVVARARFGADEVQFSVRGSGLRNNFRMRGINLLINGRPFMDADGFGDFESVDLMAVEKIELWKGANALRFGGNQAGGAINFVTPTGETAPELSLRTIGGSFGLFKAQVASGMAGERWSYYASVSGTDTDGYREHSAQERRRVFSNFEWEASPSTDLRLDLVYAGVAEQLPGALTPKEFAEDPRRADPNNVRNRYGRDYDFVHAALALEHRLDERNELAVSLHGHVRDVVHPIFQILDSVQDTYGLDVAYRRTGERTRLLLGFSPQGGGTDESRFENLGGERGDLAADFETDVVNLGLYGEVQVDVAPVVTLIAGGRWDSSRRAFDDSFLADGDRSDERAYEAFSPKVGVVWSAPGGVQVFGNVSRSYEPPLLLELTSFGDDVGFLDLDAQDTWQFEVGMRGASSDVSWDVSLFDWEVEDEIINTNVQPFPFAPFTIPSYRNVGETRHLGVELGTAVELGAFTWRSAYTWNRFTFVDDPQFGDNDLPGAPRHLLYTELRWDHRSGLWIAPNLDLSPSSYYVDSANTLKNDRFALVGLAAGFPVGGFEILVDVSNLTDERYSGTVQVDNALGRYLEPGNGRSFFAGLGWRR
jgi:iron complex outermembrane receptor protein